jgi:hypothetical protein
VTPEQPGRLARRLSELPERERVVVVAVKRGIRVEDLAEALDWPTHTVRDVLAAANRALAGSATPLHLLRRRGSDHGHEPTALPQRQPSTPSLAQADLCETERR